MKQKWLIELDDIQELCDACEVLPCVLDAAIFVNRNSGAFTEESVKGLY
jgi:hypothetical protein